MTLVLVNLYPLCESDLAVISEAVLVRVTVINISHFIPFRE